MDNNAQILLETLNALSVRPLRETYGINNIVIAVPYPQDGCVSCKDVSNDGRARVKIRVYDLVELADYSMQQSKEHLSSQAPLAEFSLGCRQHIGRLLMDLASSKYSYESNGFGESISVPRLDQILVLYHDVQGDYACGISRPLHPDLMGAAKAIVDAVMPGGVADPQVFSKLFK